MGVDQRRAVAHTDAAVAFLDVFPPFREGAISYQRHGNETAVARPSVRFGIVEIFDLRGVGDGERAGEGRRGVDWLAGKSVAVDGFRGPDIGVLIEGVQGAGLGLLGVELRGEGDERSRRTPLRRVGRASRCGVYLRLKYRRWDRIDVPICSLPAIL